MLLTIKSSNSSLNAGNHNAVFLGIEPSTTSKGEALKWKFKTDGGQEVFYFSDNRPTTRNKAGRWLVALSGKQLAENVQINAADYVGKRYLLIVTPTENASTTLTTFTAI